MFIIFSLAIILATMIEHHTSGIKIVDDNVTITTVKKGILYDNTNEYEKLSDEEIKNLKIKNEISNDINNKTNNDTNNEINNEINNETKNTSTSIKNNTKDSIEKIDNDNNKTYQIINLNKASISELTLLPGIGEATAKKIIEYRDKNGDFKTINDLTKVSGIGDAKFNKIKKYIEV
ncbi:MAG: helix-hairpin-helix domain-containing protein [Clostridia bacterium]|nr:helix-hairpin-helix domain-containing protein [Clostridia bacterium]